MIKSIHLKNFRQHTDLHLEFGAGVTVMRGANEAGKSSVFEAIAYALFGARAARNNDLTTWGQAEGSHQVTLTFQVAGINYTIRRTPRAAELTYEGGRVTGQTDTIRFCEELLNLKPGTGTKLMMVPQNEMRGTLSDGGAKTTAMIEQLADLGQVEAIIEKLQAHWHTGKTDWLESALQQAQVRFDKLESEHLQTPHPDEVVRQKTQDLERQIPALQQELESSRQKLHDAEQALSSARRQADDYARKAAELRSTEDELRRARREHDNLPEPPLESSLRDAQVLLNMQELSRKEFEDFQSLEGWHPKRVPCSYEAAQTTLEGLNQQATHLQEQVATLKVQISEREAHINNDLACPTCKRRWDNADEREAHNEQLRRELEDLRPKFGAARQQYEEVRREAERYRTALSEPLPKLSEDSLWQQAEDVAYPPVYVWTGGRIRETTIKEVEDARRKLQKVEQEISRAEAVRARREELFAMFEPLNEQIASLTSQLGCGAPDTARPQRLYDECRLALLEVERRLAETRSRLENLDADCQPLYEQYRARVDALKETKAEIDGYTRRIVEAHKANALLKILRSVKPQLANQVWQTVCQTASHYFSMMRGTHSVVSREVSGFVVDGKDTASLSGSTLDILGLAIRIALTKTFMPGCNFLLLDEPFAAADAERTAQALGFITSAGFAQTLVITHEDATEAVADTLLTL